MLQTRQFEQLAEYNLWMNKRLLDAASRLDAAEWRADRGAFFASIAGTFNHVLVGDLIWARRWVQGGAAEGALSTPLGWPRPEALDQLYHPDYEAFRLARCTFDTCFLQWVKALKPAQLSRKIRYHNTRGEAHCKHLGDLLLHLFNHQTHHRGQLTTLLYQAGCELPATDLLLLLPECE